MSKPLFTLAKTPLGSILIQLGFTTPLRKIIPVKKVFEDEKIFAFYHPKPFWEKHVVIVPKKKISVLGQARGEDFVVMGHICEVAAKIANELKAEGVGYRLITNGGRYQKSKTSPFSFGNRQASPSRRRRIC